MNRSEHILNPWAKAPATWPAKLLVEAIHTAIPIQAIEQALHSSDAHGKRRRLLTGRVIVLQILAMCLWPSVCMRDCLRNLIEGHRHGLNRLQEIVPCKSAICAARSRLGVRPLKVLFQDVVRPLGTAKTKGAYYKGMRKVAFDGSTLNVPDSEPNDAFFGRPGSSRGRAAFPKLRLVWLMEVATRAALDFVAMPYRCGEKTMVIRLLRSLTSDMLVLWDRGFHSFTLFRRMLASGANLLARIQAGTVFRPIRNLPDGSFLANLYPSPTSRRKDQHGILVRIIDYTLNDPARPGHRQRHRLMTTLLNPQLYPAKELICLYHERWEIEIGLDEIKVHQNDNRLVVRSRTPQGVIQEVFGIMLVHFAVCHLRHEAALTIDVDPDRISFVHALRVIQRAIPAFQKASVRALPLMYEQMLNEITHEILPRRRIRWYPRVVKRKMSNFALKRQHHKHPKQPTQPFENVIVVLK